MELGFNNTSLEEFADSMLATILASKSIYGFTDEEIKQIQKRIAEANLSDTIH